MQYYSLLDKLTKVKTIKIHKVESLTKQIMNITYNHHEINYGFK